MQILLLGVVQTAHVQDMTVQNTSSIMSTLLAKCRQRFEGGVKPRVALQGEPKGLNPERHKAEQSEMIEVLLCVELCTGRRGVEERRYNLFFELSYLGA